MPSLDPKKRKQAFKLRLQKKSFAEIARTLHMSDNTVRNLEVGWIDRKGVRHRGWREELERLWKAQEKTELMGGLAVREERIKVYRRLAEQAVEKIERQFPNIQMEKPSDYKAIMSELRELCRLMSAELGAGEMAGRSAGARDDVSDDDLRRAFQETRPGASPEIEPPEEAHYDPGDEDEAEDQDAE